MDNLDPKDFFKIKVKGLIADYDIKTLSILYQPLISYSAVSIFLTFKSKFDLGLFEEINVHEDFISTLKITINDFYNARRKLEAVGLLKTYVEKVGNKNLYTYVIYSPKTPHSFFEDTLLFGSLIKILGEEKAFNLKNAFKKDNDEIFGREVTSSFKEVFKPNLNDQSFILAASSSDTTIGRGHSNPKLGFNIDSFFNELNKISQINVNSIPKSTLKEIERLATLYGIDEKTCAEEVNKIYNPNKVASSRIDLQILTKAFRNIGNQFKKGEDKKEPMLLSGDTMLAKKVNLMEQTTPIKWLSYLQNNTKPTNADLRLIEDISSQTNLPNGVINALIEYVLKKNHNILSRAYVERMASALAREQITNALDAMNYLNSLSKKNPRYIKESKDKSKPTILPKEDKTKDLEDWDEIMKDLNDGKESI